MTKKKKEYHPHFYFSYEEKVKIVQEFLDLWYQYFSFFPTVQEEIAVTAENEKKFFQIQDLISLKMYKFFKASEGFFSDHKLIFSVLSFTSSLFYISRVTESQFRKLQVDWHTAYLEINKALGLIHRRKGIPPDPNAKKKVKRHII